MGGGPTQAEQATRPKDVLIADIARHVAAGATPRVAFECLAPASRSVSPSPLFVFGPASRIVGEELYGQTELGAVGTYVLDGATVAPTGIAMKDGMAFSGTAFIHPPHHVATIVGRLAASRLPARRVGGELAIIYGPGNETWGHWLVDFLPRLWVLHACGHDLGQLRFVVPADLKPMAARLLAGIGLEARQLETYRYWQEVLEAERLLMPTGLRTHNRLAPEFRAATSFWTARLRATPPGPHARVFVSRAGVQGGRELRNRARIESLAAERGYAVVRPEQLSLADQASLFAGARVIAGEYGSGLHGAVFASPGTLTVALRGTGRHPSFIQSGIAGALGQQVGYVLGETALGPSELDGKQSFSIDPGDFGRALEIAALATGGDGRH